MLMRCAGQVAKPWRVAKRWAVRITNEFFLQVRRSAPRGPWLERRAGAAMSVLSCA